MISLTWVFPSPSRNLIYTVLIPAHVVNRCQVTTVPKHDCRLVFGFIVFQNATSTHPAVSVGQMILSMTQVLLVYVAHVLILIVHHTGAVVSIPAIAGVELR